jgi:hypothetical protein
MDTDSYISVFESIFHMEDERDSVRRRTVLQSLAAVGAFGGASAAPAETAAPTTGSGDSSDTAAPTRPGNLAGSRETPTTATITWTASGDYPIQGGSRVDFYEVFLGQRLLDRVDSHGGSSYEYTLTDLTPATGYRVFVRAVDTAGNSGSKGSVAIRPMTTERFVHDCSDFDPLAPRSAEPLLTVDASDSHDFPTPSGEPDDGRLTRSNTIDNVGFRYRIPGDIDSLSVQLHKRRDGDGWLEVYESTNGGNTWSFVESTFTTYGETDGEWLHHELDVDAFSENVRNVELVLTGGDQPDAVQVGHVEIDYFPDTIPPASVELMGGSVEEPEALPISWVDSSPSADLDHYTVSFEGDLYTEVPAGRTSTRIEGLEPNTTYTVGVSAVDTLGNESERVTVQKRTAGVFVSDCSTLETAAFGTSRDRLTVDTSDPEAVERPDGSPDHARITRTELDDARLVYKVQGNRGTVTVEFHRHARHGGELLINGLSARDPDSPGTVEEYGDIDDGWIHERHTMPAVVSNKVTLTIRGGSKPRTSQIGTVEFTYAPVEGEQVPPGPLDVGAVALSESVVQVSWDRRQRRESAYHAIYVDGERRYETVRPEETVGTVLTGLSPGNHEIGVSAVSTTHTESEIVTTSVDVPLEPVTTVVDDCSNLASLSSKSSIGRLQLDRIHTAYFTRPDGSPDDARIVRADQHGSVDIVYRTPKSVASLTAEFHVHEKQGGGLTVSESADGGDSWSSVSGSVEQYGEVDADWHHHEFESTAFADDATHLGLTLTDDEGAAWSPELGHVRIEYDR